jgi:hypothetical protein
MRSRRLLVLRAAVAVVLLFVLVLVRNGFWPGRGAPSRPCPDVVDRTSQAAVLEGLSCALARNDVAAWQALIADAVVGWGGMGEAALPDSWHQVPVVDLPALLAKSRLPETACLSHARSDDGALWAVLTGPWEALDWPGRLALPLYQSHILFQFRQEQGQYVLEALLAGAPDCCGVGGQRPVEGAFYYPGSPVIRFQEDVSDCSAR